MKNVDINIKKDESHSFNPSVEIKMEVSMKDIQTEEGAKMMGFQFTNALKEYKRESKE